MTQLPRAAWQRRKIQEGSKGPMMVELACIRVTPVREALPAPRCWAVFRRSFGSQPETKYYLCHAPADYPQTELAHLTGMRWPIETALEEGKGEVGLDHFTCTHRRCGVKRVLGTVGTITCCSPFWRICS